MAPKAAKEAPVRLGSPRPLSALELTANDTLEAALWALEGAHEEARGGPLPPREQLLVLLASTGGRPGAGAADEVLGGTFAVRSGHRRLGDLGLANSRNGAVAQLLCLGAYNANGDTAIRGCAWCCCCRRRRTGQGGRCCRRCAARLWACVPLRWRERLKPYQQQLLFYGLCVRWAAQWLWEDRHELFNDFCLSYWTAKGLPPCHPDTVKSELRPFAYALGAGLAYAAWDASCRIMWATPPPIDLALA
mmetsp:Transcript_82000/g.232456  ORF Transcript_82000/g.232456 Transcript_82000/m.232456 type:complete len:248 (+) Transcript_82000:65-808(+)